MSDTQSNEHIHQSDGSTANPSKLICKKCGETYSYDTNLANSLRPTQSDKTVEEILRVVRDAGAWDDNMGGEDWSNSDKSIQSAIAALTAREERLKEESYIQGKIDELEYTKQGEAWGSIVTIHGFRKWRTNQLKDLRKQLRKFTSHGKDVK